MTSKYKSDNFDKLSDVPNEKERWTGICELTKDESDEWNRSKCERRTWPSLYELRNFENLAFLRDLQQQHQQLEAYTDSAQRFTALSEAELEALLHDDNDCKDDNNDDSNDLIQQSNNQLNQSVQGHAQLGLCLSQSVNNTTVQEILAIDDNDYKDDNNDDEEYFDENDPRVQQINNKLNQSYSQYPARAVTKVKEEAIDVDEVWDFQKQEPLTGPRLETSSTKFEEYFTTQRFAMNPNETICEFWDCPVRNQVHRSFSCTCGVYHEDCRPDSWKLDTRSCSQCQEMLFQVSFECQKNAARSQCRSIIDRKVLNIAYDVPRNNVTEAWLRNIRSMIQCLQRLPSENFLFLAWNIMNRVASDCLDRKANSLPSDHSCHQITALIDELLKIEPVIIDTSFDGFVNKMIVPDDKAKVLPENRTSSLIALYQAYYRFNKGKDCALLPTDSAAKLLKKAILSDKRMKGIAKKTKYSHPSITYVWNGNNIEKSDPTDETGVRGFIGIRLSEYGISFLNKFLKDNQIFFVKDFLKCLIPDDKAGDLPENRCLSLYSFFQMESSKQGFKPEVKSQPNFTIALKKAMKEDVRFAKVESSGYNPHKQAYKWNEETKKIVLTKESPKLQGFNGLRILNIILNI